MREQILYNLREDWLFKVEQWTHEILLSYPIPSVDPENIDDTLDEEVLVDDDGNVVDDFDEPDFTEIPDEKNELHG